MSIKTFNNLQFYHFILMKLQEIEPTYCNCLYETYFSLSKGGSAWQEIKQDAIYRHPV